MTIPFIDQFFIELDILDDGKIYTGNPLNNLMVRTMVSGFQIFPNKTNPMNIH